MGKKTKIQVGDYVTCINTNKIGGCMWEFGIVIGYSYLDKKYTIAIPYQLNVKDANTVKGLNKGVFCEKWREDCLRKIKEKDE